MELYGFKVKVVFFVCNDEVLAYGWHYEKKKAIKHLEKILEFHELENGEIKSSVQLENWLKTEIKGVVERGLSFKLPPEVHYKNRLVYENIIKIPKGSTMTYAQIAKISGIKYTELLITLMRNPFQVLIPCHRLLTNKGSLMGFYPLGKEVKRRLLEVEREK